MAAGTLALVAGFVLLLAWDLYSIKRDLEAAKEDLDGLTLDVAASTGLTGLAEQASGHLTAATDRAHSSVPLRLLSLVPGIDDQISGIRRMADTTAELGVAGATSARRIDEGLDAASEPAGRIELLDTALAELERLAATLEGIDLGRPPGLIPPLRDAHGDLVESITEARDKLADGRELITPVRDLLVGPTSFLLLAANNAEMAGGAGLALSAGVLTFDGGEIDLGEVTRAGDLRLPESIAIPDNLRDIYRPTGVGIDLRSTTRSPDLTATGPIAREIMAEFGAEVDGVLVVDAVALRDLMEVTGGVEVEGREIDAENVLDEVLHANYLEFAGDPRSERVSYQGEIAKEVFDALTTRKVPTVDLADALLATSRGRHIVLWAADPALQGAFEDLSVSGALHELGLMVSFQNYGADKLDWFLRPESTVDVDLLPSGDYRARLTMRVDVPLEEDMEGTSPYIVGPTPEAHGIFLTVHLPKAAYDITTPHPQGFRTKGEEPPMQVRTFLADVPLGTTFERTVEFSLPRRVGALLLLPSARLEGMPLTVDGVATVTDEEPVPFSWLAAFPGAAEERVSWWTRLPAVLGLAATVVASGGVAVGAVRRRRRADAPLPRFALPAAMVAMACFVVAASAGLILHWTGPQV